MKPVQIFGREPALWIGTISTALSLGTAVGVPGLSQYQVAALVVALNAIAFGVTAWQVRPVAPALFTNVAGALFAVGAAYGFSVTSETIGAVNAVIVTVLSLIMRGHVSPTGSTEAVAPPAPPPVVAAAVSRAVR